jgi:hypothetical protein
MRILVALGVANVALLLAGCGGAGVAVKAAAGQGAKAAAPAARSVPAGAGKVVSGGAKTGAKQAGTGENARDLAGEALQQGLRAGDDPSGNRGNKNPVLSSSGC